MHVTGGVIVRVKQIRVLWNCRLIRCDKLLENEGLKKPGGVREVPLGWADVGHRLHDVIFWFKTRAQRVGERSDLMKTIPQLFDTRHHRRQMRRRLPRLASKNISLLLDFFPPRLEHLVVSGFLKAINHEMLANRFLFIGIRTRQTVTFRTGDYAPLLR